MDKPAHYLTDNDPAPETVETRRPADHPNTDTAGRGRAVLAVAEIERLQKLLGQATARADREQQRADTADDRWRNDLVAARETRDKADEKAGRLQAIVDKLPVKDILDCCSLILIAECAALAADGPVTTTSQVMPRVELEQCLRTLWETREAAEAAQEKAGGQ